MQFSLLISSSVFCPDNISASSSGVQILPPLRFLLICYTSIETMCFWQLIYESNNTAADISKSLATQVYLRQITYLKYEHMFVNVCITLSYYGIFVNGYEPLNAYKISRGTSPQLCRDFPPRSDYWPKSWKKMCQDKLRLQCIEFEIILAEIKVEAKGMHILNIG